MAEETEQFYAFALPIFNVSTLVIIESVLFGFLASFYSFSFTSGIDELLTTLIQFGKFSILLLLPNYFQATASITYAHYLIQTS